MDTLPEPRRHRHGAGHNLLWIIVGILILGAGLWASPSFGAGQGADAAGGELALGPIDTPCFGNGSVPLPPPDTTLLLVKGQANLYNLIPCAGLLPGASVVVTSTVAPTGRVGVAPTVLTFNSVTAQPVNVTVNANQVDPFTVDITAITTSDDKNFEMPLPGQMPKVIAIYNPPLAVNDQATTAQNTAVGIPVLANDIDRALSGLSVLTVAAPAHGTAAISADKQTVIYTPTAGYVGSDSFTYSNIDGIGNTNAALVNVVVSQGPKPPPPAPIDPEQPNSVEFTSTVPGELPITVTVDIPVGAFGMPIGPKDSLVIIFSPVLTPTGPINNPPTLMTANAARPGAYVYANMAFSLIAYFNATPLYDYALLEPMTVQVTYDPKILTQANLLPSTLGPYVWNATSQSWNQNYISNIRRDETAHTIGYQLSRTIGEMDFFAKESLGYYIPWASKPK